MKKIIALMLAVIMVVCALASCGGTSTTATTATTQAAGGTNGTSGTTAGTQGTTQGTTATTEPIPSEPKDESLLVWLDFSFDNLLDSDDGSYFEDMSGHGNHGWVGGLIDVTDGPEDLGEAAEIKAHGDYLTVKHSDAFNFKAEDNYTIDLWFKLDTNKLFTENSWPCLFTKGSPNNTSYFGCWINGTKVYHGTGTYDVENNVNVTGNQNVAATTGLDDEWHHFVAVQKNGSIYTYVDGVAGGVATAKDISNTWDIYLGGKVGEKDGEDTIQQFFGAIDEFKIYNRALTYSEITGIEIEKPEKEELVLDLDFANMADGVVTDLTGKGHNGTVTGNVTVADGAAKFDNTDENTPSYITIKNAADVQFKKNQSFTVEITFKFADATPTGWRCLFHAGLKGQGWYGFWYAGNANLAWGGIGGNYYVTGTSKAAGAIVADTWHTITVVQDAEKGEIHTYFDGVEGAGLSAQDYTFAGDLYLGVEVSKLTEGVPSAFSCLFSGSIKNLKIYNYAVDMTTAD